MEISIGITLFLIVLFVVVIMRDKNKSKLEGSKNSQKVRKAYLDIVGESFKNPDGTDRQEIIAKYCKPNKRVKLEREPENTHDKNAISVWVETEPGKYAQIGYVERKLAADLAPALDAGEGEKIRVNISKVIGGVPGRETMGVVLRVTGK